MRREGGADGGLSALGRGDDRVPLHAALGGHTSAGLLQRLRSELSSEGLHVVLPIPAEAIAAAIAPVELNDLLSGAAGAVVVGDGGPGFFARFNAGLAAAAGGTQRGPDPLDRYTRRVLPEAVTRALGGGGPSFRVMFPFAGERPALPFQRLGAAAGLGPPGPLGVQVHPVYGPWWAYRGLVLLDFDPGPLDPPGDGCAGCDAPCVAACPAQAVQRDGFRYGACRERRLADESCRLSCVARIRCVRGPEHRYPEPQLAFHMRASLPVRN